MWKHRAKNSILAFYPALKLTRRLQILSIYFNIILFIVIIYFLCMWLVLKWCVKKGKISTMLCFAVHIFLWNMCALTIIAQKHVRACWFIYLLVTLSLIAPHVIALYCMVCVSHISHLSKFLIVWILFGHCKVLSSFYSCKDYH